MTTTRDSADDAGRRSTRRAVRSIALAVTVLLLGPLLAVTAGPASPAAAVAAAPIPTGLWDVAPPVGSGQSYVVLHGESGDGMVGPEQLVYTQNDAVISVSEEEEGVIQIAVRGDKIWHGNLTSGGSEDLSVGYFSSLPVHWWGDGRSCTGTGWLVVDDVQRSGGLLESLTVRFEQTCNPGHPFRGKVRWLASDPTVPPGPQQIPADLWDSDPDVGADQSFFLLEGAVGDPVIAGSTHLYTLADSDMYVGEPGGTLQANVRGDLDWSSMFEPIEGGGLLQEGFYANARFGGFPNPARPLFRLSNSGQCEGTGWFAIDEITRTTSGITSMTLRFGGECPGKPGFHGKVRWNAHDTTPPVLPVLPVPDDLWDISPEVTPSQSYVAIDSQVGDFLGEGADAVYTRANARLTLAEDGKALDISVVGDRSWTGRFLPMEVLDSLQPGYYSPTTSTGVQGNPFRGRVTWQNCSGGTSWFAVDEISRLDGDIATITLRFGVSCAGRPPLHGKVHWNSADSTPPSGAPTSIPDGVWDVADPIDAGLSYAIFNSELGEPIAGGNDEMFSHVNARIAVTESAGVMKVEIDEFTSWTGTFATVDANALTPGFYGAPARYPTSNPTSSAMSWTRGDAGSSSTTCVPDVGWFAIDQVTRSAGALTSVALRFDLSCDGVHHLKGKVRWFASDTSTPGRVTPVPGGLWDSKPEGVSGDYLFIEGADGDPLTLGVDSLVRYADYPFGVTDQEGGQVLALVQSGPEEGWALLLEGVDDHGLIQSGYYGDLSSDTSSNPVLGGIEVIRLGQGDSCWTLRSGWFAVDRVTRVDGEITQLDARFEQSCDGAPPLRGRIHIDRGGLPAGSPIGELEPFVLRSDGVGVEGWALDPETVAPIDVIYTVDGVPVSTQLADAEDPHVAETYPLYGAGHGISTTLAVPMGTHQVCAVARNVGVGSDTVLGCRTVTVTSGPPTGAFDVARAVPGGVVVGGWALDPDTSASIPVHVYVGAKGVALTADGNRPDVGTAYTGYGPNHGFNASIQAPPGTHQVCAYAIEVNSGPNTFLGCKAVTVPGGSPFGSLDAAQGVPGGVVVGGWALDPDTAASIPVHVYAGTKGVALTASGIRPDVGAFFGPYGSAHGFDGFIPMPPGAHQVCAYAINVGVGSTTTLACRTVVVPGGSPFGSFDVAVGGAGKVTVGGWAIDPDTAASIPVHVYVADAGTALTAGNVRNDVAAAFPGYGSAHGFNATITATSGVKQVCAYGINTGVGDNSLLGCKTVTIT